MPPSYPTSTFGSIDLQGPGERRSVHLLAPRPLSYNRGMKVTLTVIEGPHAGSSFAFFEHDAFLVGRSPDVQFRLPLKDKTLSRVHFLIEVNPPACRLMDLASTNGVRVNGKRVHSGDLSHGDRIEAGNTVLAFAVEDDEETVLQGVPPTITTEPAAVETTDWPEAPSFPDTGLTASSAKVGWALSTSPTANRMIPLWP